jgi:hypothetical protein
MQIHLRLKTKVSGGKGRRDPMANAVHYHLPNSCQEAESLLIKT